MIRGSSILGSGICNCSGSRSGSGSGTRGRSVCGSGRAGSIW